jgi:protein-arginine kinase activator protein McsA
MGAKITMDISCKNCQEKAEIEFSWVTDGGERDVKLCDSCASKWKARYRYMMDMVKIKELRNE